MEENIAESDEVKPKIEKIAKRRNYGRILLIIFIAIVLGGIHSYYVSYLFENGRNFSMLSELEREMSLHMEMGFYYSYYKTVVEENPYLAAISRVMYDKQAEYPDTVNAFSRFNIHPEVLIGSVYRYMEPWLNDTVTCRLINRGDHLTNVESCKGIGWPIFFYLQAIWTLAGVTVGTLFLFGTSLSDSIFGGLFAVAQYFGNHNDATRVMWAPNERESFAQPLLLLQMWLVTRQLRGSGGSSAAQLQVAIFLVNCFCLLSWQFTQYIFLTQTAIFFVMEQLKIIDLKTFCVFLHAHFCGLHMAVLLLQGNYMLKTSLYTSFFIVMSIYSLLFSSLRIKIVKRFDLLVETWMILLRIGICITASFSLKRVISDFLNVEEDNHVWDVLFSKFFDIHTFHTLLYVCLDVFDFMPTKTWLKLINSTLIPVTAVCMCYYAIHWYKTGVAVKEKDEKNKKEKHSDTESDEDSGIENNVLDKNDERSKVQTKEIKKRELKTAAITEKKDLDKIEEKIKRSKPKDKSKHESNHNNVVADPIIEFSRNVKIDAGVFYNISQMVVFGLMATVFMRLKLLFVPHLCVVSALTVNLDFPESQESHRRARRIVMAILMLMIGWSTAMVIREEISVLGNFTDVSQEELITWIQSFTSQEAVFAGPLTAAILLSTRRAIVNHPHYEHKEARDRMYATYKTYGKFSAHELYQDLTKLRVTHLVLDKKYCYGTSSKGCSFEYIWDTDRPELAHQPRLCDILLNRHVDHFYRVFQNKRFSVYKVHDYSVRYMPRTFDT